MQDHYLDVPFVTSVFHPSDFSARSENAFAHALAIALHRQTEFTILHAGGKNPSKEDWTRFPAVRSTLERWGFLEKGSRRSAVFEELRVNVKKILARSDNPVTAALEFLEKNPTDLIVLATEGREGLSQWVQPSVAERLAQRSKTKTLFVPREARGFISLESGAVTLRKILVPVDHKPDPTPAIVYSTRTARLLEKGNIEVILLQPHLFLPRYRRRPTVLYRVALVHLPGNGLEASRADQLRGGTEPSEDADRALVRAGFTVETHLHRRGQDLAVEAIGLHNQPLVKRDRLLLDA